MHTQRGLQVACYGLERALRRPQNERDEPIRTPRFFCALPSRRELRDGRKIGVTMKKFILPILICLNTSVIFGQTITLTFTGNDVNNQHIQLDSVVISNLSRGWCQTIYYPDTVLSLTNGVGIADNDKNRFYLSQNAPNPFNGKTTVSLQMIEDDNVRIDVYDLYGRVIMMWQQMLEAGSHSFSISLSKPQLCMLSVINSKKSSPSTIKMINVGNAGHNNIKYLGSSKTRPLNKGLCNKPFVIGDLMEYVGYATVNGVSYESTRIIQQQGFSQSFIFEFSNVSNLLLPVLSTNYYDNVTFTSVDIFTTISSDGGTAILSRGVCYDILPNPTLNNTHTIDGSGVGSFTSILYNLSPGTTYYVRSYATNSIGTAYSDEISFSTTSLTTPTVSTSQMSSITYTTAISGGNISSDGGAAVTARGVCWGYSHYPTLADNFTSDAQGIGSFSSNLTNLNAGTTYYVRAYATNNIGTTYGNEISFTTNPLTYPSVNTDTTIVINSNSATIGGEVTDDGGTAVIARGICWSTNQNPTLLNAHTVSGVGLGPFVETLTGLSANVNYYARAYATNTVGTTYGNIISFKTSISPTDTTIIPYQPWDSTGINPNDALPCFDNPIVVDHEGNIYHTVQIGIQCWMRENLRTTTSPSTGTYIVTTNSMSSYVGKQARWFQNDSINYAPQNYGLLYNWCAAMDTFYTGYGETAAPQQFSVGTMPLLCINNNKHRGICPEGWHIPNRSEWNALSNYLSQSSQYTCNFTYGNVAKAMAVKYGWASSSVTCSVGAQTDANNSSNFSAISTGTFACDILTSASYVSWSLNNAYFWASDTYTSGANYPQAGCIVALLHSSATPVQYYPGNVSYPANRNNGASVRCLKD